MGPLKLAWKFVTFYDLNPWTLRRLAVQYGLQECGGFSIAAVPDPCLQVVDRPVAAIVEERDPRVRRCLRHQALLTQQVLALRIQGMNARVRGWLIEIDGGKVRPQHTVSIVHPRVGRSRPW